MNFSDKTFVFLLLFFFLCCNNNSKKVESSQEKIYQIDIKNTSIEWHGYKTTDKVKVSGVFNDFSCDRENQEFASIKDLLTDLKFSINTLSSSSGDPIRDINLKDYFFNFFTSGFQINGTFGAPDNDSINIFFNVFGVDKKMLFSYKIYKTPSLINEMYFDHTIHIKGTINIENQFNALKAYDSIHKKCYELHKGLDGISMTWKDVDVHLKARIITK